MRYRKDYQKTHDIDWFFKYKENVYHAASNGGLLPDCVDSMKNRTVQEKLEKIEGIFKVEIVADKKSIYDEGADLSSFIEYASKGLISLDRREIEDSNRLFYHIVASPIDGSFINDDILKLVPTLEEGDIEIV